MAANLKDRKARKVSPEEAIDITSQRSRTEAEKRFPGEIRYEGRSDADANVEAEIDRRALTGISNAIYRDSYEDKRRKRN